jgi:flavodoxin
MKAAVVYWSGTGNTAAMADLVLEGMKSAGADAELIECNSVTDLSAYDAIAFGCPPWAPSSWRTASSSRCSTA